MKRSEWPDYAHQFRRFVNEHNDFLITLSSQADERNLWNCICSVMDWLDVSIDYLYKSTIKKDNWQKMSMQIILYISCIDIVWECIKKLHVMFIDSSTTPFEGENLIFQDSRLGLDDNRYFKHLRAAFGAHPVDLNEGEKKKGTENKRYASWPLTDIHDEYDFSVFLYSERRDEKDVPFGFKIEQLDTFFEQRYIYLEEIKYAISQKNIDFDHKLKTIEIERSDNPLTQLHILLEENKKRVRNDYLNDIIEWLISFFSTEFIEQKNSGKIATYKMHLIDGINDIYQSLQNMEFDELKIHEFIYPEHPSNNGFDYAFATLSSHAQGYRDKPLIGLRNITSTLEPYIVFHYESTVEFFWLTLIGMCMHNGILEQ